MAGKLILTVGLPASGKSTWARKQWEDNPEGVLLVERDETRTKLFGEAYHRGNFPQKSEAQVTAVNTELTKQGLRAGKTVIVSDTNLNPRFLQSLVKLGRDYGAEVSLEHFDVPVEECKRRNKARGKRGEREVPDFVMERMAKGAYGEDGHLKEMLLSSEGQAFFVSRSTPGSKLLEKFNRKAAYSHPLMGEAVVLVDVDGTLANNQHHAVYYLQREGGKKNFVGFYKAIAQAPVNTGVRDLANRMRDEEGLNIIVLTGRDDSHAQELLDFIQKSGIKASRVMAKREGDYRPDRDFKREVLKELREEGLVPVHALDDREASIRVMEEAGLLVSRVEVPTFPEGVNLREPAPEPRVNTIYGSGYCIRCGQPLKEGNIGPKCRRK